MMKNPHGVQIAFITLITLRMTLFDLVMMALVIMVKVVIILLVMAVTMMVVMVVVIVLLLVMMVMAVNRLLDFSASKQWNSKCTRWSLTMVSVMIIVIRMMNIIIVTSMVMHKIIRIMINTRKVNFHWLTAKGWRCKEWLTHSLSNQLLIQFTMIIPEEEDNDDDDEGDDDDDRPEPVVSASSRWQGRLVGGRSLP